MSYEKQDASLRLVGIAAALLAFGIAASLGASAWWYAARYRAAVTPDPQLAITGAAGSMPFSVKRCASAAASFRVPSGLRRLR